MTARRPRPLLEQLAAIDADARAAGYTVRTVTAGTDRLTGMPSLTFTYGPPSSTTGLGMDDLTADLLAAELEQHHDDDEQPY